MFLLCMVRGYVNGHKHNIVAVRVLVTARGLWLKNWSPGQCQPKVQHLQETELNRRHLGGPKGHYDPSIPSASSFPAYGRKGFVLSYTPTTMTHLTSGTKQWGLLITCWTLQSVGQTKPFG